MKSLLINLSALIFFPCFTCGVFSQQRLLCGNGKINKSALDNAIVYEQTHARVQQVDYLVRVYFHVFRDDDGTQEAASPAQINSEFTSLLASYSADNVCFLFAGVNYTNSTALNQNFNADSDPSGSALSSYQVPNCINIFYMRKINGNNPACNPPCGYGGIALGGIPGTFCLVATPSIGAGNTIGHEVGHCLGLLHTFETAFGLEKINGSNSSSAGDRITDTPADPFAYNGMSCYSETANGCAYNGTCKDPDSASNFSPPYTNLMSYWYFGNNTVCVANPTATTGQFNRVDGMLNTNAALINCSSPSFVTQNGMMVSSGYYMRSAINTFTTSGNILIDGTTRSTLGGGLVTLQPGFRAAPTGTGLVRIITKPCN